MDIQRAECKDSKYLKYQESLVHNTAFIAKEQDMIVGIFEYKLFNTAVQITNISFSHTLKDRNKLFTAFINELLYWSPYITEIIISDGIIDSSILYCYGFKKYKQWIYINKRAANITKLNLKNIIPAQLTVNVEKVKNAATWIKSPKDIIVCFIYIDGVPVVIDGYSRLTVAYYRKYRYIYGYEDKPDDEMIKFYRECLRWCKESNINSIEDLSKKLVTPEQHQKIWVDRCSNYFSKH